MLYNQDTVEYDVVSKFILGQLFYLKIYEKVYFKLYNKKYKNCENISQFFLFIGIIRNGDEIEEKNMCNSCVLFIYINRM